VEGISKQYRLGMIGGATLREDLSRWWAMKRGKPDPLAKVGGGEGRPERIGEPFWALKDVSFEVKQGEILGIIGRNGAGKSTLLKILSRITAPTEGVVKIRGRVGSLLEVGTGFHPELTGRENIYLNGAILGMSRREVDRKLDEIITFSECEQFIDTPVKRYSSGMYVRLAFAVAAHLDPEILIVDEVLAVGDAAFQKKCLGKMGEVSRKGRTVLFVSHNMASVTSLCSRAILLEAGGCVLAGEPMRVVRAYISGFRDQQHALCGLGQLAVSLRPCADRPMTIIAVRVRDASGAVACAGPPLETELTLEIDYRVNRADLDAYLACVFVDAEGTDIWWRYDGDTAEYGRRAPGAYRAVLRIPKGFLRAGAYGVRLAIVDPTRGREGVIEDRGIVFEITIGDNSSLLARRRIRWPSAVRCEPGWRVEPLPHLKDGEVCEPPYVGLERVVR